MTDQTTQKQTLAESSALQLVAVYRGGAKTLNVVEGASLVVGRAYPADMVVDDSSISRQHATVRVVRGALEVSDHNSTNGVWLNGHRVAQARVPAGEAVRLGDVMLILQASPSRIHGIDGYDTFSHWLEQELDRARTFGRPLTLVSIAVRTGASPTLTAQLSVFANVGARLRPVDRMGMYGPAEVLVGLPETPRAAAAAFVEAVLRDHPEARATIAHFPDDARTIDALLSALRAKPAKAPALQSGPSEGAAMARARADVMRVAASKLPVLLHGETGVGKELFARLVHDASPRKQDPFVSFNCASVPQTLVESVLFGHEKGAFTGADKTSRGIFEQAHTGTLFLDEVGELSAVVQAALLRVLETGSVRRVGSERDITVDVRIVAATHRNLEAMVQASEFRQDLLFRLEGALVRIPPLRERQDEIGALADAFLRDACQENQRSIQGFSPAARAALLQYGWPGNIRELKNAVHRATVIAVGAWVDVADLPERVRSQAEAANAAEPAPGTIPPAAFANADLGDVPYRERVKQQMDQYERELIEAALLRHGGNQTAAAAELKIPVRTLAHKLKELGIRR